MGHIFFSSWGYFVLHNHPPDTHSSVLSWGQWDAIYMGCLYILQLINIYFITFSDIMLLYQSTSKTCKYARELDVKFTCLLDV